MVMSVEFLQKLAVVKSRLSESVCGGKEIKDLECLLSRVPWCLVGSGRERSGGHSWLTRLEGIAGDGMTVCWRAKRSRRGGQLKLMQVLSVVRWRQPRSAELTIIARQLAEKGGGLERPSGDGGRGNELAGVKYWGPFFSGLSGVSDELVSCVQDVNATSKQ